MSFGYAYWNPDDWARYQRMREWGPFLLGWARLCWHIKHNPPPNITRRVQVEGTVLWDRHQDSGADR